MKKINITKGLLIAIGIYSFIFLALLNISVSAGGDKIGIAIIRMATGLVLIWVVILGGLMYFFKDKIRDKLQKINLGEKRKFVLTATVLALIEEAVAVFMTNLAPQLGVKIGEAFITASANYFYVVLFHSVIIFIPMFVAWSFLLTKYEFSPAQVFLLFGLTGSLSEMLINPISVIGGFWFFIYGLMVFLPAYSFRATDRVKPHFLTYLWAIFFPLLLAVPLVLIIYFIRNLLGIPLFIN